MLASLAAGAAITGVNNMLSEYHANKAHERQLELMEKQNAMNRVNALSAYSTQVHGMRMAGLNPASLEGAGNPNVAAPVSQGSAAQAENVQLDPMNLLLNAQVRNVEAQTNKTNQEAEAVAKVNQQTDAANDAAKASYLEHLERQIADLTDEAAKLPKGSKEYEHIMDRIDKLNASKERVNDPQFVGALGIAQGIYSAAEAVKADFDTVNNFLRGRMDKKVLIKQGMDPGTVDSLAGMPRYAKEHLVASIDNIKQNIAESESREKLNDQQILKLQQDILNIGNEILHRNLNDPVWIRTNLGEDSKEWKAWTDQQWRDNAFKVGTSVLQGIATGTTLGAVSKFLTPVQQPKGMIDKPDSKEYKHVIQDLNLGRGVQNFRF